MVDPYDTVALTDAIRRMDADAGLRTELSRRGRDQAAQFTLPPTASASIRSTDFSCDLRHLKTSPKMISRSVSSLQDAHSRPGASALLKALAAGALAASLAACQSLGASGPSSAPVSRRPKGKPTPTVRSPSSTSMTRQRAGSRRSARSRSFAEVFGQIAAVDTVIGKGDVVDVAIWEAPPAVLFGVTTVDARLAANPLVAQSAAIPQQMVGNDGAITIPFVGSLPVAGRTPCGKWNARSCAAADRKGPPAPGRGPVGPERSAHRDRDRRSRG